MQPEINRDFVQFPDFAPFGIGDKVLFKDWSRRENKEYSTGIIIGLKGDEDIEDSIEDCVLAPNSVSFADAIGFKTWCYFVLTKNKEIEPYVEHGNIILEKANYLKSTISKHQIGDLVIEKGYEPEVSFGCSVITGVNFQPKKYYTKSTTGKTPKYWHYWLWGFALDGAMHDCDGLYIEDRLQLVIAKKLDEKNWYKCDEQEIRFTSGTQFTLRSQTVKYRFGV